MASPYIFSASLSPVGVETERTSLQTVRNQFNLRSFPFDKQIIKEIRKFCKKMSSLVEKKVIDSSWVPGVENYLRNDEYAQTFVVISATPQDELERILDEK